MFTGIVEDTGIIRKIDRKEANLTFQIFTQLEEIGVDDSISCNGICLTAEHVEGAILTFTAIRETILKTNAGKWKEGDLVNLERTLRFNGRIDGHLVQGHVDSTGICKSIASAGGSHEITFSFNHKFRSLIIEKGSICINGTSLTAYDIHDDYFKVSIIPFTREHTNFHTLMEGDTVNLEFDMVGKYIYRYLTTKDGHTAEPEEGF